MSWLPFVIHKVNVTSYGNKLQLVLCKYIYFDMCWFNRLYIHIILRISRRVRAYQFLQTQFGYRIATNKNLQGWIKPAAKWKALQSIAWGTGKNTKSRHLKAKNIQYTEKTFNHISFAPWTEKNKSCGVSHRATTQRKSNENKPSVRLQIQMTEIRGMLIGK